MPIAKKPNLGAKEIDKIIKKGGSTTLESFKKEVINMSLKLSPQLNSTIGGHSMEGKKLHAKGYFSSS